MSWCGQRRQAGLELRQSPAPVPCAGRQTHNDGHTPVTIMPDMKKTIGHEVGRILAAVFLPMPDTAATTHLKVTSRRRLQRLAPAQRVQGDFDLPHCRRVLKSMPKQIAA